MIPAAIAEIAVSQRPVCGKYKTKREGYHVATDLQYIGFYCILKSLTKSGQLQGITKQIEKLMTYTNMGERTIYYYLKECQKRKYLVYTKNNVKLNTWDCLFDYYREEIINRGLDFKAYFNKFKTVTYEIDNKQHSPRYIVILAEVDHNQDKQAWMIEQRLENIRNHEDQTLPVNKKNSKEVATTALFKWINFYISGTFVGSEDLSEFYSLNACTNRGLKGITKAFQFKSKYRVTYLKHQMEKRGFVTIKRNMKVFDPTSSIRPDLGSKPKFKAVYDTLRLRPGHHLPDSWIIINHKSKEEKAA